MICELRVEVRGAGEQAVAVVGLISSDPERDLVALAPYRLEVLVEPGGLLQVGRVGRRGVLATRAGEGPEVLGLLAPSRPGPLLALVDREVAGGPYYVFPGWPGEEQGDSVRSTLARVADLQQQGDMAGALALAEGHPASGEEPRLLLARAELLRLVGRGEGAAPLLHLALEAYANHLPALQALVTWDSDAVLARMACARILRLAPEEPEAGAALATLRTRFGDEAAEAAARAAPRVDLASPFREQWSGAGWTRAGRQDPLTAEGILRLCLEAAFRDGRLEDWEAQLAGDLGAALGLDAAARQRAFAAAQEAAQGIAEGGSGALDRVELFERLASLVLADGVVEEGELEILERAREALEVAPEEALRLLRHGDARHRGVWVEVEALLQDPWDSRRLHRLREALFVGSATLRPGLSDAYASTLDEVRVARPQTLSLLMPPLCEVARYSGRLVGSVARALEVAATVSASGRAAAMALARANPRQRDFHVAVARGIAQAVERSQVLPHAALRDLNQLVALSPDSEGLSRETATVRRRLGLIAARGSGDATPAFVESTQARAARWLSRLRAAAPVGARASLVEALEELEGVARPDAFIQDLQDEARTEACLAAGFHRWRDVLEGCLARDLAAAGQARRARRPWGVALRLLAASDLAWRRQRRQDLEGYRVRFDMLVDRRDLTPEQAAYCARRWAALGSPGPVTPGGGPPSGPPPGAP